VINAKKSLGQHWLDDEFILGEIVRIAGVQAGDTVLEVGPGHGTLTKKLCQAGANVVAIEKDEALADQLIFQQLSKDLQIIKGDILGFNLNDLPSGYKVVANIPYYLTSNLIRLLSESKNPPISISLLVQKEVAERVCATPGQMSILGISAQFYYDCQLGIIVPAAKFRPPPKVDSQVIHMRRKSGKNNINTKQFFRVVKAGFSARRKTLHNSLAGGLNIPKDEVLSWLENSQIPPSTRPQELSLEQWIKLTNKIHDNPQT